MRIDTSFDEGVSFLTVAGDIDLATAKSLKAAGEKALSEVCGTLRINLAGVTFLDSTGLGALIHIRNTAAPTTTVILENPTQQTLRLFEITGLDKVFILRPIPFAVRARSAA
jgi:anti-sigma B factor antagonist